MKKNILKLTFTSCLMMFFSFVQADPIEKPEKNTNKIVNVSIPSGHLVFKKMALLNKKFTGYPFLEFHNVNTGKVYKYINEYYGYFFLPNDVLPSDDYAIIQLSEQGYVEGEDIKKQFYQLDKAFLLNYKTGCMLDTGMSFASWYSPSELVNDASEDSPRNVSQFQYGVNVSEYPWTGQIPTHLMNAHNKEQTKALLLNGFVSDGFGMSNQLACLPISHKNLAKYQHIYHELKGYKYVNEAEALAEAIKHFTGLN